VRAARLPGTLLDPIAASTMSCFLDRLSEISIRHFGRCMLHLTPIARFAAATQLSDRGTPQRSL